MGGKLVHEPAQRRRRPHDVAHTEELEQTCEVDPHLLGHVARQIDTEHRLRDDIHGQVVHLGGDIDRFPLGVQLVPPGEGARAGLGHLWGEQIDLTLGEDRLHQPTISVPESLVEIGHQPAAETDCQQIVFGALDVIVLIGHQHMTGQFRIADNHRLTHGCPRDDDVILPRQVGEVLGDGVPVGGPDRPECETPRLQIADLGVMPPQEGRPARIEVVVDRTFTGRRGDRRGKGFWLQRWSRHG